MKLAEALLTRGNLQSKLNEIRNRLINNAIVQEGESPAENPEELLEQTEELILKLQELITKINLTNASLLYDGKTMTELLARRDTLRLKINTYREFLDNASSTGRRARGSEIKILPTVKISDFQKKIDDASAELRNLEIKIQELNWTNDLCG